VSFQRGRPLPALYVRKERKDHGSARLVEGDKSLRPGLRVALLEDVVTTGGSSLKTLEVLRQAGATPIGIIALVDRLEGGGENIRAAGVPLVTLTTRRDFIPD
jgi:orotate phosphoribosyltransferase